jgi:hypothetical protein
MNPPFGRLIGSTPLRTVGSFVRERPGPVSTNSNDIRVVNYDLKPKVRDIRFLSMEPILWVTLLSGQL